MKEGKLIALIKDVADIIKGVDGFISVLTHYDADGLASGGAITRYLSLLNKRFVIRSAAAITDKILSEFFSIKSSLYIVQDMGSGDIDILIKKWRGMSENSILIVIDHHKLGEEVLEEEGDFIILNPEIFGYDGGKVGCTSVLTSLVGYFGSGERDKYFVEIGLVGATGDMQLNDSVEGINKYLLDLGVKLGIVKYEREFVFFTPRKLPVHKAIVWNMVPYIPGFSGRDDIGLNIVRKSGIKYRDKDGRYLTIEELRDDDKEKLLELITKFIASKGIEDVSTDDFLVNVYYLLGETDPYLQTTGEFSNILSSCGRMDREEVAILLAAGFRNKETKVLDEAKRIFDERRKVLARYLNIADSVVKRYGDRIVLIDMRGKEFSHKFSGTISTLYSRSPNYRDDIIVVLSYMDKEGIKISARAPRQLVDEGFDLSVKMRMLSKRLGGRGGGHNVAAGALVPLKADSIIVDELIKILSDGYEDTD